MASTHVQCWDGNADLVNVKRCITQGHPILILMRGVPGSGKTHLAKELVKNTKGSILSTDNFFTENGGYSWDPTLLQEYHKKNLNAAKVALSCGVKPIIIDNTNIYAVHMSPYITQAVRFQYEVYFVEPQTKWKAKPRICAMKNTHNVGESKISYWLETYDRVSLAEMIKPVTLKLTPPLDADFDEDGAFMNISQKPFAVSHVHSWAGLLPTSNVKPFPVANFWQLPTAVSTSSQPGTSAVGFNRALAVQPKQDMKEPLLVNLADSCEQTASEAKLQATEEIVQDQEIEGLCKPSDDPPVKQELQLKEVPKSEIIPLRDVKIVRPVFSLLPESQILFIPHVSIGIQTSDIIRTLFVNEIMPGDTVRDAVITKSDVFMIERLKSGRDVVLKEHASQTESSPMPTELELLFSMFPYEAPADILHLLQTCGFKNTVGIYFEMHARLDLFSNSAEDALATELLRLSESYELSRKGCNGGPGGSLHQSTCGESADPALASRVLPPSSKKQRCSPEPVKEGHYRLELSLDMIRKLSELFGDGDGADIKKAYADLPLWFCRQLFQYWQGLPITGKGEGFLCSDFDSTFPSVVSSEFVQEESSDGLKFINNGLNELNVDKSNHRKFTTAQKLQLNDLFEEFSGVDRERIEECYCDTNFSVDAVRNTLNFFLEQDGFPRNATGHTNTQNSTSTGLSSHLRSKSAENGKTRKLKSCAAEKELGNLQEEIDYCMQQRDILHAKANTSKVAAVKQFYMLDAQRYDKRAKSLIEDKNECVARINNSRTFVDLHHMNVPAAIKLLKEKLGCLDRPANLRNGRSDRKLVVITGYGKSSNGAVKLKPAVLQWLQQSHYDYHLTNPGEVVVTAK